MESYKKPTIVAYDATRGIIPVAALGAAVGAPVLWGLGGLLAGAAAASAGAASVASITVGSAVLAGAAAAAVGAAATKLAGKITLTDPVLSLTERKNFA